HTFEPTAEESVCFFCGEASADGSCQITVPVCGDVQEVDLFFGKGIEYRYADIAVPRCHRCRDEHRELPGRIEKWHEARLAAEDPEHFPKEAKAFTAAKKAASEATAAIEQHKRKVGEAENSARQAEAIGTQCDRCNSKAFWDTGLCRRCDSKVYRLGTLSKVVIAAAGIVLLAGVYILQRNLGVLSPLADFFAYSTNWSAEQARRVVPLIAGGAIPMLALAGLVGFLKRAQRQRRRELREQRQADFRQRRKAPMDEAQRRLAQARSALEAAEEAARKPLAVYEEAKQALRAARQQAVAEFEGVYPEPRLATGIKPESAYVQFSQIQELRQRGWGYGHEIAEDGKIGDHQPVGVAGLVAREPRPARERVVVACPVCGKKQRIPKQEDVISVKCPCGQRFDCCSGRAETLAELKARNLHRWMERGDPERWIKAQEDPWDGPWDESAWSGLLESLRRSQYWPMDESAIGEQGHLLELIAGQVQGRAARGASSGRVQGARPGIPRALIVEQARQASKEETVICPVCDAKVKAKNLVRHYDKNHGGAEIPGSAGPKSGAPPKSARNAAETAPTAAMARGGDWSNLICCPHCGKGVPSNLVSCAICGAELGQARKGSTS
ncbi:MAG: hypothetical protein ACOC8H_01920, partial [bacterium]